MTDDEITANQQADDDSLPTFSFTELRITLTAFSTWFARQHGLTLMKPAAVVDQFLEDTTSDPQQRIDDDGLSMWQREYDRIQERTQQ